MMMGASRLMGVLAVLPASILLTISFFVLILLRKIEGNGLKAFGYVVAALLWVSTFLVFSMGIYVLSTGRHPALNVMKGMGCYSSQRMSGPMMGSMMMQRSQDQSAKTQMKGH